MSEDQAYQWSRQHSWHLEDLACWQKQAAQHPSTHPVHANKLNHYPTPTSAYFRHYNHDEIPTHDKRKVSEKALFQYLIQHPVQFISSFNHTVTIIAINHKDKSLSVLEVMSPQRTNLNVDKVQCIRFQYLPKISFLITLTSKEEMLHHKQMIYKHNLLK